MALIPKREFRIALLLFAAAACALGQDISLVGGGGFAVGEEAARRAVTAAGVSAGFPFESRHRVQFDYLFHNVHGAVENRHFFTGSYLVQGSRGRTRPFFQVGAGLVQRHTEGYFTVGGTNTRIWVDERDHSLAILFGAGATVNVWKSLFIRPQLRVYAHVGPTLTVLPGIAAGWNF